MALHGIDFVNYRSRNYVATAFVLKKLVFCGWQGLAAYLVNLYSYLWKKNFKIFTLLLKYDVQLEYKQKK